MQNVSTIRLIVRGASRKNLRGGVASTPPARARVNPAAAGPPRHPHAAGGGGHKVAPLYFCDDIVGTRKDREAKLCTHLPEYVAEVVSKFGVDPI